EAHPPAAPATPPTTATHGQAADAAPQTQAPTPSQPRWREGREPPPPSPPHSPTARSCPRPVPRATPALHSGPPGPPPAAGRAHCTRPTCLSAWLDRSLGGGPSPAGLYGTSTSFPFDAALSSSSCARRASVKGRRSATTGWILPPRSRSSIARKSSRNHSALRGPPPPGSGRLAPRGITCWPSRSFWIL